MVLYWDHFVIPIGTSEAALQTCDWADFVELELTTHPTQMCQVLGSGKFIHLFRFRVSTRQVPEVSLRKEASSSRHAPLAIPGWDTAISTEFRSEVTPTLQYRH